MRNAVAGSMGALAALFFLAVTAMANPVAPDWIRLAYAPARYSHDCAYDTMRHTVVMFGGRDSLGHLAPGIWEWDGADWTFADPRPSLGENMYAAADLNGSCNVNGIDITFGVAYLKGLQPAIRYCPSCPPRYFIASETPGNEIGWMREMLMNR